MTAREDRKCDLQLKTGQRHEMSTTAVAYTTFGNTIVSEVRNGVAHDYMRDPLGSTVGLIDSTQTITDSFEYWPYGEIRSQTGTTQTPFRFVGTLGYFLDAATAFCYVRARHLVAALARWLTVDPLWPRQPGYGYVEGGPVSDPDRRGMSGGSGSGPLPICLTLGDCFLVCVSDAQPIPWGVRLVFLLSVCDRGKDLFSQIYALIAAIICAVLGAAVTIATILAKINPVIATLIGLAVTILCALAAAIVATWMSWCEYAHYPFCGVFVMIIGGLAPGIVIVPQSCCKLGAVP